MNIWPVTAVVSGQSRLGGKKIGIILNIAVRNIGLRAWPLSVSLTKPYGFKDPQLI